MESMDDFQKELDASFRVINEGDTITGIIVNIEEDHVTLDLNYFVPGIVPTSELSDDPNFRPMFDLKIGEPMTAEVIELDDGNGNIVLSRKAAGNKEAWGKLEDDLKEQTVLSLKITAAVPGGVICYPEGIRGFIPASKLALSYVEDPSEYVGKTVNAIVTNADEKQGKLVLSVKQVLLDQQNDENTKKMQAITPGIALEGTVASLMPYGAFIDLDNGLTGLVHISKICQKRIRKPSEVLKEGQRVKVKVLSVKDGKLSLSMKEFDEDVPLFKETEEAPQTEYKSDDDSGLTAFGMLFDQLNIK